ncbi:MAG: hypothetical protein HOP18_13965 [Deltaproteobacteria bacterium]|nr:hypothetical protein [Deltaproteobacteria bacterium]
MSFRIVIIPSRIAECFSVEQVAACLARGIARVLPTAELLRVPLATKNGAAPLPHRAPSAPPVEALLHEADLVLTVAGHGEPATPSDRVIVEVTMRARELHLPVIALVGTVTAEAQVTLTCGIDSAADIPHAPGVLSAPLSAAAILLEDCVAQIMRLLVMGQALIRREDRAATPAWQTALAARVNALRKPAVR